MNTTFESHVVEQPNQKGLKFYANKRQGSKVLGAMIQRLAERGYPYNFAQVPQAKQFLPANIKVGSREHAIYLFIVCLWMRGGQESDTATFFLKSLHEERPKFFEPARFKETSETSTEKQIGAMSEVLTEFKLEHRLEENAPAWVYNMRKLDRFWNGNPARLVEDQPAFPELAKRIMGKNKSATTFKEADNPHGFALFRKKMTSMLTYFLMDAEIVPVFYTPVPVDFHVMRLFVENQILGVRGKNRKNTLGINFYVEEVLDLARAHSEWFCREHRVSPVALCDALWLLSRTLCRRNPGNSGVVADLKRQERRREEMKGKTVEENSLLFELDEIESPMMREELAPLSEEIKGRKRYLGLKWDEEELEMPALMKRIQESCGRCPVNHTCCYNVSSGNYYVGGKLVPERLRVLPKNGQKDLLDHPEFRAIDPSVRFTKIYMDH